jgi:hypothetical protein
MSSPAAPGGSASRRSRTVEGSCWPCKQRRVKCDLQKPSCRRCSLSPADDCSYDKILLRWKERPASTVPASQPIMSLGLGFDGSRLPMSERRAIEYFQARLWPLFSTVHEPCPPPIALALRSQPVLQALCVFSEEHRALQDPSPAKHHLEKRRLHCLSAIRGQLCTTSSEVASLSALLVAVLLLYFLEGYLNCTNDNASTVCHLAGALAIINTLGGFEAVWKTSDRITRMLLSELASTDLTDALLQGRQPSFPADIWTQMEADSVWWESVPSTTSLGSVLSILAEMSFYYNALQREGNACDAKIHDFECALQSPDTRPDHVGKPSTETVIESRALRPAVAASLSLIRAFQHTALIYLYSAICKIPINHYLVQQQVHACLECIQDMDKKSKAQNCALFPLYVAGAHSITDYHRACVLETLDTIYSNLQFQSVVSIRTTLRRIWQLDSPSDSWSSIFQGTSVYTLVI